MNDVNSVMVSVYCITYNHGKYIRNALEGFVNQKTNFSYEVLVHDDASTDNTADIIREYAEKYPDIIKPIYQTENQHSKKIQISGTYLLPRTKGKYVALCEGDDYWTDENKLQKQFDVMEEHTECTMCSHYVKVEYMADNIKYGCGELCPKGFELKTGIIESEDWMNIYLKGFLQTSSFFMRSDVYKEYRGNFPEFAKKCPVGDTALNMYLLSRGKLYFINEVMSCYRKGAEGSWTQRIQNDEDKHREHRKRYIQSLKEYRLFLNGKYNKTITEYIDLYTYWHLKACHDYKGLLNPRYIKFMGKKNAIKNFFRWISSAFWN